MIHFFKKALFTSLIVALPLSVAFAQNQEIEILKRLNYAQMVTPTSMDNFLFSTYYSNGKKAYNMKSYDICKTSQPITCMRVNPSGSSYAVLTNTSKKAIMAIRGLNDAASAKSRFEIDMPSYATTFCYTADSRHIVVAEGRGLLIFYRSNDMAEDYRINFSSSNWAESIIASPNDYYIAVQTQNSIIIINQEMRSTRAELPTADACAMAFSEDSEMLGVLTPTKLDIYDTRTFNIIHSFENLEAATSLCFHPEGKYVTVAERGNRINFYNIVDNVEKLGFDEKGGGVTQLKYLKDGKGQSYLVFNTNNAIRYYTLGNIRPNYKRMLRSELEQRMTDFIRRRDNETVEQYNKRVTEESIKKHRQLVANELATRYAGDLVGRAGISIDRYDSKRGVLALDVQGTTSKIYLNISAAEASTFTATENIEFRNVQYGITENDGFEVVYAEVYNKATGKSYTFDSRSQQNLEFLTTETERHMIEDIKYVQRDEIRLKQRTKEVADKAKKSKRIQHTAITSNAQIVRTTDASGRNIKTYKVDFEYNVDAAYSATEDFPAGKYMIEESRAATTMLEAIIMNFSDDFSKYFVEGKKLEITVTGAADASPIRSKIAYEGCYGIFEEEPYYLGGNLNNTTITPESGITQNEQLAFMRAQGVRQFIQQNMPFLLSKMDVRFVNRIELPSGEGSKFRRIKVSFSFIDAEL